MQWFVHCLLYGPGDCPMFVHTNKSWPGKKSASIKVNNEFYAYNLAYFLENTVPQFPENSILCCKYWEKTLCEEFNDIFLKASLREFHIWGWPLCWGPRHINIWVRYGLEVHTSRVCSGSDSRCWCYQVLVILILTSERDWEGVTIPVFNWSNWSLRWLRG